MLEKQFTELGWNKNEREVYLAIRAHGKISAERVARETEINRTTVYSICKKLKSIGVIGEDLGQKIAYFYPESLDVFQNIFSKEEKVLAKKKSRAIELANDIASIPTSATYSVPRIKFIEEDDLTEYLYGRGDAWMKEGLKYDQTWWGYHDCSFTLAYGKWIDWCWSLPEGAKTKVKFFSNDNSIEEHMTKRHLHRDTHPLPRGVVFDSSLWVAGDFVIMAQTRNRPHYIVEINDAVLARNQRTLFSALYLK